MWVWFSLGLNDFEHYRKNNLNFYVAFLKIGKSNWQNLMKWFGPLFMYIFIAANPVITLLLSAQFCM